MERTIFALIFWYFIKQKIINFKIEKKICIRMEVSLFYSKYKMFFSFVRSEWLYMYSLKER